MSKVIISEINGRLKKIIPDMRDSTATLSEIHHINGYESGESGYAIKLALEGTEKYWVNGTKINVAAGQYLLLNKNEACHYDFSYSRPSKGICIRLGSWYLDHVFHNLTQTEKQLLEYPFDEPVHDPGFVQGVFTSDDLPLGNYLQQLVALPPLALINSNEVYLQLAAHLLQSQSDIGKQVRRVPAKRSSTRREIYDRLCKARLLMDETLDQPLDIGLIANRSAMSEFHFFRSFKETFLLSPYQYYLNRRLQHAAELLRSTHDSITEIGLTAGFADLPAFSRSFKKLFQVSPMEFRRQHIPKRM
jgi:AraC family transcriptional regulator